MTLASIQKISEIRPIPNADNIEVAKVLGWEVVIRKGEFKEGDLCIYIEIDTILPRKSWSEFLFKHQEEKEYRLRTIKLRKQISQGLIIPLSPTLDNGFGFKGDFIGQDVTDFMEIKKYEKPLLGENNPNSGYRKFRNFPSFLRKTDEVRIQSEPKLLEELEGKPYYITQKMDGTSATFYKYKDKFGVCSRNMELLDPRTPKGLWQYLKREVRKLLGFTKKEVPATDLYWKMAIKYNIEEWLPEGFAIQGEICGPNVQGNKMGLEENELFVFNVWIINKQIYMNPESFYGLLTGMSDLSLDYFKDLRTVRTIVYGNNFGMSQEDLLKLSTGYYDNESPQEGIVVRSIDQTTSFKVINNEFLLKYGE